MRVVVRTCAPRTFCTVLVFLGLLPGSSPLVAQQPTPSQVPAGATPAPPTGRNAAQDAASARLGRPVSNAEIARALATSGLTPQQVRDRLRTAGLDPTLADPFLGATSTDDQQAANPTFVAALQELGLLGGVGESEPEPGQDSVPVRTLERAPIVSSTLFGKDFFTRSISMFDAAPNGPVDPGYRLGPGDQLQLIVTGDVEVAYSLEVRRDGSLIVPVIGQVNVNGLTLDAARTLLRQRAKRVYSSVEEGKGTVDLSVGRVRSVLVYVVGEVEKPGAYQVSAIASPLTALARAGGPTSRGSFRDVRVMRAGNQVASIDLYHYLVDGTLEASYRLEQGDIISVPPSQFDVSLAGAVRRPGTFQLLPNEHLGNLLHYGGGLLTTASTRRIQLDRVLPPQYRTPGHDRVIQDIFLEGAPRLLDTLTLLPGDRVEIFGIGALRRNRVVVKGEVFQPGTYEFQDGMKLGTVLTRTDGFLPWALTDRIKVVRLDPETGRQQIYSLDYADTLSRNFPLKEYDEITVLDARRLYAPAAVSTTGAVNTPASLPFRAGMTLADAIDLAGGLREDASVIEVARRRKADAYSDTLAVVFSAPVRTGADAELRAFRLEGGDQVAVRTSPGYRTPQSVQLTGAFVHPGTYTLLSDRERIADIVRRAGGLLPTAYRPSFRMVRASKTVAVDFDRALAGSPSDNIELEANDVLRVGTNPGVVFVSGAVSKPVAVPYRPELSVSDYVELAGGPLPGASSTYLIEGPSGRVLRSRRILHLTRTNQHAVEAGSIITAVAEPQDKEGSSLLTTALQVATTVATLAIALRATR